MAEPTNISKWLKKIKQEQYIPIFEKSGISINTLKDLSEADLVLLGVSDLGDRKKIIKAVKILQKREKATLYSVLIFGVLYILIGTLPFFKFEEINQHYLDEYSILNVLKNLDLIFKDGVSSLDYMYLYPLIIVVVVVFNAIVVLSVQIHGSFRWLPSVLSFIVLANIIYFLFNSFGFNGMDIKYTQYADYGFYLYVLLLILDPISQFTFYSEFNNDDKFDVQESEEFLLDNQKLAAEKELILDYFRKDKIDKLITTLNTFYEENNAKIPSDWLLLQNQWKAVQNKTNLGLISVADNSEENAVKYAILKFINILFDNKS